MKDSQSSSSQAPFTDKDLERWKTHRFEVLTDSVLMKALLHRLEAAEALLPAWKQQNGEQATFDVWCNAENEWLKSKGAQS